MYCQNCGAELAEGSRFCPNCGQQMGQPMGQPGGQPMGPMEEPKKNTALVGLIVAIVVVLFLIAAVAVVLFMNMFERGGSVSDSDDRGSRQESVEDSDERREDVEMKEEDREEYAMEVAEDYWEDFFGMIADIFTADSGYEFIDNIEGIEDFFYDRYPEEVAQAIYGGEEYGEFREIIDELKDMSPSELEEEFDEGMAELGEQGSMWEQIADAIKIKAIEAEEFDEEKLEEIKEEIEKDIDRELEDFDWGYKVKAEISATLHGETESEEGYFYVLCIDDKCSIYATELNGDVTYMTEKSLF